MATADELLNAVLADDGTEPHIVVNSDRTITVPKELRRIAVQYDHNIETATFDCPRYWDGIDMSVMVIYINYFTPDNRVGCYPAKNIVVDEVDSSIMHFDWTITKNVTLMHGDLSFLVCINTVDDEGNEEYHWNSEMYRGMSISEGLECNSVIAEMYPDVITELVQKVNHLQFGGVAYDDTLTLENYPAEAKTVGDRFAQAAEETNEKLVAMSEELVETIDAKFAELPISVSEDGYTDITGLRQVTDISLVREDTAITITTTLQGDQQCVDTIILDEYERPVSGTSDGTAWTISWEGFDI